MRARERVDNKKEKYLVQIEKFVCSYIYYKWVLRYWSRCIIRMVLSFEEGFVGGDDPR
jgi:hypothetical protein